jgi:hypothetical protein
LILNEIIVWWARAKTREITLWMALSNDIFNTFSAHAKLENDMAVSMPGLNEWPTFVLEGEVALA